MTDIHVLGPDLAGRLRRAGLEPGAVVRGVDTALAEDLAGGTDLTTAATNASGTPATAAVVAREKGFAAGLAVAEAPFLISAGHPARPPPPRAPPHPGRRPRGPGAVRLTRYWRSPRHSHSPAPRPTPPAPPVTRATPCTRAC